MKHDFFDVVVIGGGPAGCSAAITLAQLGVNVLVIEAKEYPHHKVCGEFLSAECERILDSLGLFNVKQKLKAVRINSVRVISPNNRIWEADLPKPALSISRSLLDASLAARAIETGIELRTGTTVTSITGNLKDGFECTCRTALGLHHVRSKAVIAAYGKRSQIDRKLGRRFLKEVYPFIGLKAHYAGPSISNRVDMFTFKGGYCGLSNVEDGSVNVCLLCHASTFSTLRNQTHLTFDMERFINWMQSQNSLLAEWFSKSQPVHPDFDQWLSIAQIPFTKKNQVENDILMVGDAVAVIAPLAGNGISMALQSGNLAAVCLYSYLNGRIDVQSLFDSYTKRWEEKFTRRIQVAKLIQPLMLNSFLIEQGIKIVNFIPSLGALAIAQTRDD